MLPAILGWILTCFNGTSCIYQKHNGRNCLILMTKKKKVSKSLDNGFSIEGFLEVMASSKGKSAAPVLWSTVQIVSY